MRQLHENVVYKYVSISVASILMMLTIMLIANGSATIMSRGNELTRGASVYDFTVMGEEQNVEKYLSGEQMLSLIHICTLSVFSPVRAARRRLKIACWEVSQTL